MNYLNFSHESRSNMALRMMDGKMIDSFSLISAFLPHTNYGVTWRSVIDYRGGVSKPYAYGTPGSGQVCVQPFKEHGRNGNHRI